MNTRFLGTAGIAGGLCLLIAEVRHVLSGAPLNGATIDQLDDVFYLLWGLGMVCAFWAVYKLGATGANKIMRAAPFVAMAGFVAMIVGSILDIAGLTTPATNPAAGVAWLLILLGTLIVGILTLVARAWPGWRKFTPLICILAIPTTLLLGPLVGQISTTLFGLSWMLLGFAVLTSADQSKVAPQPSMAA